MNPSIPELRQYLKVALTVSRLAATYLRKEFRQHPSTAYTCKKHQETLTLADQQSNQMIIQVIKKTFPEHNIISEEAIYEKTGSPFCWYIDPLDGTSNFASGSPLFAVNLGLTFHKEIVLGVITLPFFKETYWAIKDGPAFLNNKKLHVSKVRQLKDSFVQVCHSCPKKHRSAGAKIIFKLANRCRVFRNFGCAGIELTNLAAGRVEAAIIKGSRSWDNLAGTLIVRQAGGRVTDFQNRPWQAQSADLLATNQKIHGQLLKILKDV